MLSASYTVNEIKEHNYLLEMVLDRFDVSSKNGNATLEIISLENGCNLNFLIEILNLFDSEKPFCKKRLQQYNIPTVIDYLQRTHKYYLSKRLFEIESSVEQVCHAHYNDTFVHSILNNFFTEFKTELWEHIEMEENFLFPHVQFLISCAPATKNTKWLKRRLLNFSLQKFIADHNDNSETQLSEFTEMLDYLYPKEQVFSPVSILHQQLKGFEKDLHIHALVEDEVLIPKVLAIETELLQSIK